MSDAKVSDTPVADISEVTVVNHNTRPRQREKCNGRGGPWHTAKGMFPLFAVYIVCMILLFRPALQGIDPRGYYSWVRSLVIDGDLDTRNDFLQPVCGDNIAGCIYQANPYGIGMSLLLLPFYLVGHLVASLIGAPRDGYSTPYLFAYGFGITVYAFIGLVLMWQLARTLYDERSATIATVTVWLASPLVFYMFPNGLNSHAMDVFVNALFLFVYARTRGGGCATPVRLWTRWLLYGVLIGIAMLVRLPNVFLGIVPLVDTVARLRRREQGLSAVVTQYACLGIGVLLALLPQMAVWKVTRGAWLLTNPYQGATRDTTDFLRPHVFDVLFSSNRGFLLWAPGFLVALFALPLVARRDRRLAGGLCALFLLHFYLISSWSAWSGGFGFGPRLFVATVPLGILGLAALVSELQRHLRSRALWLIAAGFITWNILLMGQYVLRLVPSTGTVNVARVIRNQFTLIPNNIGRLLRAVAGRGR
jgi:hypothetical protein